MSRCRRRAHRNDGFTLIELVIAVAILGVVMLGLTGILLTSLVTVGETEERLDATNALRKITSVFERDVASAVDVKRNVSAACGSGTAVIEMWGATFTPPAPATPAPSPVLSITRISYVVTDVTVDGQPAFALTRRVCEGPAPTGPVTQVASTEVASPLADHPTSDVSGLLATLTLTPVGGDAETFTAARRTS